MSLSDICSQVHARDKKRISWHADRWNGFLVNGMLRSGDSVQFSA